MRTDTKNESFQEHIYRTGSATEVSWTKIIGGAYQWISGSAACAFCTYYDM